MAHAAIDRRCTLAEDGEGEAEPRMGAAMALAVASRTGLLHAMLKDDTPRSAEEWAALTRASKRSTEEVIISLVAVQAVAKVDEASHVRYHVPANRANAVKEMGAIFEALLLGKKLDETTLNLIKFRCEKMLSVSTCA
jgi:hypothetical protein